MSSTFSVPIASNAFHSHNGRVHGHTRSQHRRPGHDRLPAPFALPRIPSERYYSKSDDAKLSPEKDNNAVNLSNQQRFQANNSIQMPPPLSNGALGVDIGEMNTFPLSHPSPGVAPPDSYGFPITHEMNGKLSAAETQVKSMLSSSAILNALLLPLPFLLTSLLRPVPGSGENPPQVLQTEGASSTYGLRTTCVLASLSLLLLAGYGKAVQYSRSKDTSNVLNTTRSLLRFISFGSVRAVALRTLSVGLPLYATSVLSGFRVALVLLVVAAAGMLPLDGQKYNTAKMEGWKNLLGSRFWILAFLFTGVVSEYAGFSSSIAGFAIPGYFALLTSIFWIVPPYLSNSSSRSDSKTPPPSAKSTSAVPATPWEIDPSSKPIQATHNKSTSSSEQEIMVNTLSGLLFAIAASLLSVARPSPTQGSGFWLAIVAIGACMTLSFAFCDPSKLRLSGKSGLGVAMLATVIWSNITSYPSYWAMLIETTIAAFGFLAVHVDQKQVLESHNKHGAHHHHHHSHHEKARQSRVTKALLKWSERYPLLHSILAERDSRRIFYFMCLNFAFMLVQTTYGVLTGSLGLLSDSIHMFFDCLALVVGLCAAVMSKWPPSVRFPYGYGKVDTLAGFANGVFLMIISIEIVYEALERLSEGFHMQRLGELLSVSAAGLAVNLVGIMCFEHAHHGHDHGHGGHDHGSNENMYGIYLHILADTMGSVAVVISTLLIQWLGWPGFDPLASCVIALLIFASAIPLVQSSAKTLLLSIPEEVEYGMRDTLAGVSGLRGVVGYTVPKFWLDDLGASEHDEHDDDHAQAHDHHHDHTHDHSHDHQHSHSHSDTHSHNHNQNHNHSHSHHHHHGQSHDSTHSHTSHKDALAGRKVLGVMHVIASKGTDLDEVRERTVQYLQSRGMEIVVQVEREGDNKCWCRGGFKTG